MKTKLMKTLLAVVCLLSSIGASAYDFMADGICYNITSLTDKTCSVTKHKDSYEGYKGHITIPANVIYENTTLTVTSIYNYAFDICSGLTGVTIPNTVTSIGKSAFFGCTGLTSITIPNSVTSIGESAFFGCAGLTSVTISNSMKTIGSHAFSGCTGLMSVTIPNSVTSIGIGAFSGCAGLTSVTISNSVTSIEEGVFNNCTGLTSVTIPNSVTSIGISAFSVCSRLTSVTIPNSVTSIGISAFYYCPGLTSVTIPSSVTSIGNNAFMACSGLTSVTIPNSVTSIGIGAFAGCSGLTSMTIPNSVTSIGNNAFNRCSNIKSLVIDDGEENLQLGYNKYTDTNTGLFFSCPLEYVYIGRILDYEDSESYGYHPFYNCIESITEIAFGKYTTNIPDYTKDFSNIETITLHNPTPPNVSSSVFTNTQYMNLNVYVPKGSLEAYQKADVWKNFRCLQEKDLTGIETVVADGNNTDNVIYDMLGRRLDAPKAGLNIINGKKVMIRK